MKVQLEKNGRGHRCTDWTEEDTVRIKLHVGSTVFLYENGNGNLVMMSENKAEKIVIDKPDKVSKYHKTIIY